MTNEINTEILKRLEEINKKQQLTNELLLANYHILQEHIQRQNSPVALLSEELDDYFTERTSSTRPWFLPLKKGYEQE